MNRHSVEPRTIPFFQRLLSDFGLDGCSLLRDDPAECREAAALDLGRRTPQVRAHEAAEKHKRKEVADHKAVLLRYQAAQDEAAAAVEAAQQAELAEMGAVKSLVTLQAEAEALRAEMAQSESMSLALKPKWDRLEERTTALQAEVALLRAPTPLEPRLNPA